jgi:hypothetical protein
VDFIYCEKCRGHHDSGLHSGRTDSATENNRTVKKAWAEYTRRNPDARPREGRTPSAVPPRTDADSSSDPIPPEP